MAAKDLRIAFALLLLLIAVVTTNAIKNNKVTRNVQLGHNYYLQETIIEFTNNEEQDIQEYILLVDKDNIDGLVYIEVELDRKVANVARDDSFEIPSQDFIPFRVDIGTLEANGKQRFIVKEVYSNRKAPYSTTMKMRDVPQLRIIDDAYYPTLYETGKMKSTFECNECHSLKATEIENTDTRSKKVKYGTYKNVKPLQSSAIYILIKIDLPQPVFTSVKRDVTISHWSSIDVEEQYNLKNQIPALDGGFSRVAYNPATIKYAVTDLYCELPSDITELYYTDEIGNITTSHARRDSDGVKFSIEPRFPVMGGWKTYWQQGYKLPKDSYIMGTGNPEEFEVKISFSHPFEDIIAENFEFSITLPEGATDTRLDIPFEMESIKNETVYRYLDLSGREKIIMKRRNVLERVHDKNVRVTYRLPQSRHFIKPVILVVYIFILLFFLQQIWRCSSESGSKAKKE
ncbi:unnamed protein product [Moneuplotes crassus]|uniref:Dolichyl-diphosphooligosaccharide--protein glycosyltransferase subunit 1 n=1 Tax=Euplotes crassus TaxID=5936 RepID=A0AAD1UKC1_EUPCR|nr:unnamed protein product [Moneuplotes crassus]